MTESRRRTAKRARAVRTGHAADEALRDEVRWLLRGGGAHAGFDAAVANLPARFRGARPPGLPHTPWRLVEHMRLAQRDILEFCTNPEYESPPWPEGYWPEGDGPPGPRAWAGSIRQFREDARAIEALVVDDSIDLFATLPWGEGAGILHEALLVADHNAYHIGQLIAVRRALGAWKD
jgi:hypothetical protein